MYKNKEYLEEDFIIFNSKLGLRDFVTIGEIDFKNNQVWLDNPYEFVGPLCLEKLCTIGEISFEACIIMSQEYWKKNQRRLQKESFENQLKFQRQFQKDINNHNKKRRDLDYKTEKENRELLGLPLEGVLEISQIKAAFKKIAKTAHPDVGGTHEMFVKLSDAKDALIQ